MALASTSAAGGETEEVGTTVRKNVTSVLALAIAPMMLFSQCEPACTPVPTSGPYPTGRCDNLTAGLPGLNTSLTPAAIRQIGTSVQGRDIYAEYWGPPDAARVVMVIAQIHGDECAPSLVVEQVRQNAPTDFGVWLIPTMNPDGYAAYTRRNANDADLNADGYHRSQPETQALMAFTAEVQPILSVHVHSPNGFAGWYGTGTYRIGDPVASGAPLSSAIAEQLRASGLGYSGAGSRSGDNWFLWQGQRAVHPFQETLLLELHAVSDSEVPSASPRPATRTVETVRNEARALLQALAAVLSR